MPALLDADPAGNRDWNPAHPSEDDIKHATRIFEPCDRWRLDFPRACGLLRSGIRLQQVCIMPFAIASTQIRFLDGLLEVDMGDCNLVSPQAGGDGGGIPPLAPVPVMGVPVVPGQAAPPPAGGGGGVAASVVDEVLARLRCDNPGTRKGRVSGVRVGFYVARALPQWPPPPTARRPPTTPLSCRDEPGPRGAGGRPLGQEEQDRRRAEQPRAPKPQQHAVRRRARAARPVCARRDDAAYLQTGLATLWSTAPDAKNGNGDLALSPPGLYTPDAVDGIRAGLLRALKTKNRALERNAPSQIEALLPALKLVLSISTIRDAVAPKAGDPNAPPKGLDEVLSYPWSDRNQAFLQAVKKNDGSQAPVLAELKEYKRSLRVYLTRLHVVLGAGTASLPDLVLQQVEQQAQALRECQDENKRLENSLNVVRTKLLSQTQLLQSAQKRIAGLKQVMQELLERARQAEDRQAELNAEIQDLNDEIAAKQATLESLQAQNAVLTQQLTDQSAQLAQATEEEAKQRLRADELFAENSEMRAKLIDAQAQCNAAKGDASASAAACAAAEANVQQLEERIRELSEAERTARQGEEAASSAVAALRAAIETLDEQLEEANRQFEARQGEIAACYAREQGHQEELRECREMQDLADKEASNQRTRAEALQQKLDQCLEDHARVERLLDEAQAVHRAEQAESFEEIERLRIQIQDLHDAQSQAARSNAALREESADQEHRNSALFQSLAKMQLDALPNYQERIARARELSRDLGLFATRALMDPVMGNYRTKTLLSSVNAVAQSEDARSEAELAAVANSTQFQAECDALKVALTSGQPMGWSDALYTDALALICPNLRSWEFYEFHATTATHTFSLPISVGSDDEVFCFVPLTSVAKAAWDLADEEKRKNIASLLCWIYNLPTATVDASGEQASDARWTLEEAPAGDGASALPYLKYALPRQLSAAYHAAAGEELVLRAAAGQLKNSVQWSEEAGLSCATG